MRTKIALSMLVIIFVVVASLGATMAWFTAESEPIENVFEAGTLTFDVVEHFNRADLLDVNNVNPGDCYLKEFEITNTGSKNMLLRMQLTEGWKFDKNHLEDNWDKLSLENVYGSYSDTTVDGWITDEDVDGYGTLQDPPGDPLDWIAIEAALEAEGWYKHTDDYWYYENRLGPGADLEFDFNVCFDGSGMGNEFQGAGYKLTVSFEAVQASNNASGDLWGVNSLYDPADPQSGENWDEFDF